MQATGPTPTPPATAECAPAGPLLTVSAFFAALTPIALSQPSVTTVTHEFSDGSVASAQQVNENFQDLATAIDDLQVYNDLFSVGLGSGF